MSVFIDAIFEVLLFLVCATLGLMFVIECLLLLFL